VAVRTEVLKDDAATTMHTATTTMQSSSCSLSVAFPNTYKFTGQERDSESGADYFDARHYTSIMGRFLQPDPAGLSAADPSNPQSWNRYAYVLNNPLSNIDPAGLDCIHINVDTGDYEGFDSGDCDNSTEELANSGVYVNGTVNTIFTTTGDSQGVVTGYSGTNDDTGALISGTFASPLSSNSSSDNWWGTFGTNLVSNWSWGVRGPNQTYRQCLAGNSGNYSLAGAFNQNSSAAKLAAGNDVASLLFGDAGEGQAGLLLAEGGTHSINAGIGTVGTMGRRTASVFDLNLAGTTGPAPAILGKTGAEELAGWLSGIAEAKFAGDVGATGALALGCLTHP
jgi:RHS repeat-associated protein